MRSTYSQYGLPCILSQIQVFSSSNENYFTSSIWHKQKIIRRVQGQQRNRTKSPNQKILQQPSLNFGITEAYKWVYDWPKTQQQDKKSSTARQGQRQHETGRQYLRKTIFKEAIVDVKVFSIAFQTDTGHSNILRSPHNWQNS